MTAATTREFLIDFLLVLLLLLFFTLPGSLVLAGFDPPYGLSVGILTWMSAFIGLSPVAFLFLLIRWKSLGQNALPVLAAFSIALSVIAFESYVATRTLYGVFAGIGFIEGFLVYCIASVLGAALSLMLFPVGILPGNFLYDPDHLLLGCLGLVLLVQILFLVWIRSGKKVRDRIRKKPA